MVNRMVTIYVFVPTAFYIGEFTGLVGMLYVMSVESTASVASFEMLL